MQDKGMVYPGLLRPQRSHDLEGKAEYGSWRRVVKGIRTSGLDFDLEAVAPTIVVIMT